MNVLVQRRALGDQTRRRRTANIRRWLQRDNLANLAVEMYTADDVDQGERHAKGHSSPAYYVKDDEDRALALAVRGINHKYRNFFDLGVGGECAVRRALELSRRVGAENYFACDLAPSLAIAAVKMAQSQGFNAAPYFCDIFEPLPFCMHNSLIGVLGLTNQNIETYGNPFDLKERVIGIYRNFSRVLKFADPAITSNSGLLLGWDANMNAAEVKACYDNPEFGELVISCLDHIIDTDKFVYEVIARNVALENGEEIVDLSTGLRALVAHSIEWEDESFAIPADAYFRVLNSTRFNVPLQLEMLRRGGFRTDEDQRWTATGRVYYQHCTID